jgi:DNA-binding CsgD family transcriptional regulator
MRTVTATVFVGREPELGPLAALIAHVKEEEVGGAVWVEGPPGIGKSGLIAAALTGVERDGCRVRSGAASELSPDFPFQVMLEALAGGVSFATPEEAEPDSIRRNRAEIMDLLSGTHDRTRMPADMMTGVAERLVAFVARLCTVSPAILVVDDAQWADQWSIAVLTGLAGMLRQLPLLLIIATRPVPARAEVIALHQDLTAAGGLTIELGPLSDSEAAEITRRLIGVPPSPALGKQLTAAAGNPLYLHELIDSLMRESRLRLAAEEVDLLGDPSDLPTSLSSVTSLRLGFLSESALSALRVAAMLGSAFSMADLGTVTGQRPSELADVVDEAVRSGILTDSAPGMTFRHELLRHALYYGMPASLRSAFHRQAAGQLARAGAQPDQVAIHVLAIPLEADPWVIGWIADAAPMLSRRAPQLSADLLIRARKALAPRDARREYLDAELATAQLMLGDDEQAARLARPALAFTRDPALAGQLAWVLGCTLPRLGRVKEAIEATDETIARAELPPVWIARLRARRAMSLFEDGQYDEALSAARQAKVDGNLAGDRLATGYALYTIAEVEIYQRRNLIAAKDAIEKALALLAGDPEATDLILQLTAALGRGLSGLGMPDAADGAFAGIAAKADRGTAPCRAHLRALSAVHAVYRGRWDDALAEAESAERLPLDTAYRRYLPGVIAQIAVHRDDHVAADLSLRDAENAQLVDTEVRVLIEFLLVAWALAAERDARPAEALARLLTAFDPDGTGDFTRLGLTSSLWLPDVVRLALADGESTIAAAAARACAREASAQGGLAPEAAALHCQGLLDADPNTVLSTADLFQSLGYPLPRGQALENAAVLYAEHGDVRAARAAYLQAIDIYRDLGAEWDIIRADSRLRQYGIRRGTRGTRGPTTGWDALTSTEGKIAGLIAEGLSNPDIAGRLFLSRSTVQTHVSRILTKLGAQSRVEIARSIPRRPGRPPSA